MFTGLDIEISQRSQQLIKKYFSVCNSRTCEFSPIGSTINFTTLIALLHDELVMPENVSKENEKKIEFLLVSLRAELLRDLLSFMGVNDPKVRKLEDNSTWTDKLKFGLLTAAGVLVAGCQGFDSITTMMSLLTLPSIVILLTGLVFSVFSIAFFCGFDLVRVSNGLGVRLGDVSKLLEYYLLQLETIKAIRRKIATYNLAELAEEDLQQLEIILSMLQERFNVLTQSSKQFEIALNSKKMQIAKTLASGVAGLLFFGGGFFAGQSVALFVCGLFMASVTPAFWPVIVFSAVVGLAALSIYWYVERAGLKKLISGWFGLDEDDVAKLCDEKLLAKEEKKLENLKEKVLSTAKLTKKLAHLEKEYEPVSEVTQMQTPKISTNIYSFIKASDSNPQDFSHKVEKKETEHASCSF